MKTLTQHKLEPALDFPSDNSSVLLHQGQAEFKINGNSYSAAGEVHLQFLPRAGIYLTGEFQKVDGPHGLALTGNDKTSFALGQLYLP